MQCVGRDDYSHSRVKNLNIVLKLELQCTYNFYLANIIFHYLFYV